MDTGTPTRESFEESKKYSAVRFIGSDSRDLMDWELNELQKILAADRKNITDQVFKDGSIIYELGATIGLPQPGVATGDDIAECSGSYQGVETQTYTVSISQGGAPGIAKFNYQTSGGDSSSGEVIITAFDAPLAVGTLGVYISFTDGGDGVLNAGDSWIIPCTFGDLMPTLTVSLIGDPEEVVLTGDDTAASSGDYTGLEDQTYRVTIATEGVPGIAEFSVESDGGDGGGESTITAFDSPIAVGTLGVYISFTDGGDGKLIEGDSWNIACPGSSLDVPSLRVYCQGRMEPVDGTKLFYTNKVTGFDYVYLERIKYKITYDEDSSLVNPDTG